MLRFSMETGVMNTDNKMCNISLTSSMEDYLEAVLVLQQKHGYIRCVDVAGYLGVTKPSVSRAVKELSKKKCLLKKDDGTLSLTEQGRQIAQQIYEKHQFFTKQLIEAGVPRDIAVQDACRLEHVISETSFNKLKEAAWMKAQEVIPSEK
ncbi:metal-dependent transcriptional regulator [Holdemania massiliensis]|jgi:Mn-dependent DtxR family transcriptional regulator|nr:HTH-type transcriptional regulator MntR [Eubacterium callanderi]